MRIRFRTLAALSLLAAGIAFVTLVVGPTLAASAWRSIKWSVTEIDAGELLIDAGNRLAEVEFSHSFPSPPIVTVTPQSLLGSNSFAVVRTDGDHFRLELAAPAEGPVWLSWTAFWDVWGAADDGLPTTLHAVTADGRQFGARIEAYARGRPSALLVPNDELEKLAATAAALTEGALAEEASTDALADGGLSDDEIADAALAAARTSFNDFFTCSWLDRVRDRVGLRADPCPTLGALRARERWQRIDRDAWAATRERRGLAITLRDSQPPAPVALADAVASWAGLLRTSVALDLFPHNNQVLDFLQAIDAQPELRAGAALTVIHFDSHSDLWTYPDPRIRADNEDIAEFFNAAITSGLVKEVYWVLPDWTRTEPFAGTYWAAELPATPIEYIKGPATLSIFVDEVDSTLYFGAPPSSGHGELTTVLFHKVLASELPDFAGIDNVYLEVDGDFFSNTGYDTELRGGAHPDRSEQLAAIDAAAAALRRANVVPKFASWCLSPQYTELEDELDQELFFLSVLDRLGADDYLLGYAHADPSGRVAGARNSRRESALDRYLLELRYRDHLELDGDRIINLNKPAERALGEQLAAQRLGLNEVQIRALMNGLDRFDGVLDGAIKLQDAEYFAAFDDPNLLLR